MKTAFTMFPYGLRVSSFVAVSDAPIRVDRDAWIALLRNYRIDGRPVIDSTIPAGRAYGDSLARFAESINQPPTSTGLETRESVLSRIPLARIVTDDNMVPEFRRLLLFPW